MRNAFEALTLTGITTVGALRDMGNTSSYFDAAPLSLPIVHEDRVHEYVKTCIHEDFTAELEALAPVLVIDWLETIRQYINNNMRKIVLFNEDFYHPIF